MSNVVSEPTHIVLNLTAHARVSRDVGRLETFWASGSRCRHDLRSDIRAFQNEPLEIWISQKKASQQSKDNNTDIGRKHSPSDGRRIRGVVGSATASSPNARVARRAEIRSKIMRVREAGGAKIVLRGSETKRV